VENYGKYFLGSDKVSWGRESRVQVLLDPTTHLFTKARYNACPTIRFVQPWASLAFTPPY
jgi:hypothetical protein